MEITTEKIKAKTFELEISKIPNRASTKFRPCFLRVTRHVRVAKRVVGPKASSTPVVASEREPPRSVRGYRSVWRRAVAVHF